MKIDKGSRVFVDSTFNMFFPRNINIRERVFDFEVKLKGKYQPAQVFPIIEQIEPEMPRFAFVSVGGHSTVNVSQISASMMVRYSGDYLRDYHKCEKYLKERIDIVYPIVRKITDNDIKYCGLLTKVKYVIDKNKEKELLRYLCEKFMSEANYDENITNVNLKYTIIKNDTYFLNFFISDDKRYISDKIIPVPVSLSELKLENLGIQVVLDINDRWAFNKDKMYKTTKQGIEKILKLTRDIIYKKLDRIIEKGEIKLC